MEADYSRHLDALGRLVSNGQLVEVCIGYVLARVLGVEDHVGGTIAGRSNTKASLAMISDLTDDAAVISWTKRVSKALDGRNRYVHGVWGAANEGEDLSTFLHRGKTEQHADSVEALKPVVNELLECIESASELLRR